MNMKKYKPLGINKKYAELFYRFSSHFAFESMIDWVREIFDIDPEHPESTLDLKNKISKQGKLSLEAAIDYIVWELMPKYMEPEGDFLYYAVENYIIYGKDYVENHLKNSDPIFRYGIGIYENLHSKGYPKFAERHKDGLFLYIPPYISKKDLISIIERDWNFEIKKRLLEKNKSNKNTGELLKVRTHLNRKRDNIIYDLYNKTRQELGLKRGEYKEIKIASLLKEEHGISIEPENIKMIVLRQRRLKERKLNLGNI